MRSCFSILVFGIAVLFAMMPVSAEVVNVTTSTQLFYDGYEGLGTNVSHAAYPDDTGDFDPVAVVGSGTITYEVNNYDGQVTDHIYTQAVEGIDLGPYEGKNYLRMQGSALVQYTMGFTPQNTADDRVHYEQMLCLSDLVAWNASDFGLAIYGKAGDGTILFQLQAFGSGDVRYVNYAGGTPPPTISTGLAFDMNVWQKWEIDYAFGAATGSLTIDGETFNGLPFAATEVGWGQIIFNKPATAATGKGVTFVDEVPEPAGMVLLLSGMVGLLAYAWRKRR